MPNLVQETGVAYYATATGVQTITAANAAIIGVLFASTGTAAVQFFAGATASASIGPLIVANSTIAGATINPSVYFPYPAYASGGFTIDVYPSADPRLVIFWNPLSNS